MRRAYRTGTRFCRPCRLIKLKAVRWYTKRLARDKVERVRDEVLLWQYRGWWRRQQLFCGCPALDRERSTAHNRMMIMKHWLRVYYHLAPVFQAIVIVYRIRLAIVDERSSRGMMTRWGDLHWVDCCSWEDRARPVRDSFVDWSRTTSDVRQIMLLVEVAAKTGHTLTGKDAEYSSLMFGELCRFY